MQNERFLLELCLTNRNNLAPHTAEPLQELDLFTARRAIDRVQDRPLKIKFAGGEPLLCLPLVEQICQYTEALHLDAVFVMRTNGTLADRESARVLAKYNIYPSVNLQEVPRTSDLSNPLTADMVHGIRALGAQGLEIGLNAKVTDQSIGKLQQLVDFAYCMGNVSGIGLDLSYGTPCTVSPQVLRQTFLDMVRRSRQLARTYGKTIRFREIERGRSWLEGEDFRDGRSNGVVLMPDGTLYPLDFPREPQYVLGKLSSFQPDDIQLPALSAENAELTRVLLRTGLELAKEEQP